MSPTWSTDFFADQTHIALFLILGAGLLFVLPSGKRQGRTSTRRDEPSIRRPRNTSIWRRTWWRIYPPIDVMRVDGLAIDRTRRPHCAWLGPTGAGKSASVATVRVDGRRPTLIVTPDLSDPLIAAALRLDGFRWTACESRRPVNFLIGTPQEVAERLTEVFRSGGVGAWKRTARRATASVITALDEHGTPRSLLAIGAGLQNAVKYDRDLRTVCAGWVERFLDLADQFGSSIGEDGTDVAELLRQGKTVLLDLDAFEHPALTEDIVALGLAEAKRCASRVPGGFRLIFEEAGQIGERIDLAAPFFRAGRRRSIAVDVLTQAETDLKHHGSDAITSNVATRFYFAQELASLQQAAADRLGLKAADLDPATMKDFTAWVAHGRIRRLVRFPKPPKARISVADTSYPEEQIQPTDTPRRIEIIELQRIRVPGLPAPSGVSAEIAAGLYRQGECERWRGSHLKDKQGNDTYGRVWLVAEGRYEYVHRLRWILAYGPIPLDEEGKPLTIDHLSGVCVYKDCSKLTHLELVSRGENSRRRWRVRGVGSK